MKIRAAEPRKQKHDRRDAELILKLLVEKRFPAIWRPSKEQLDRALCCCTAITGCACARRYKMPCGPSLWRLEIPDAIRTCTKIKAMASLACGGAARI